MNKESQASKDRTTLEDRAKALVAIVNSTKPQEERAKLIWEILQDEQ